MTLKPYQIGDRGQRFEIHCVGYPEDGDNVIGWHSGDERAVQMAKAIRLAPGATRSYVLDREDGITIEVDA